MLPAVKLAEIERQSRAIVQVTKTARSSFEMNADGFVNRVTLPDRCQSVGAVVPLERRQIRAGNFDLQMRHRTVGEEGFASIP